MKQAFEAVKQLVEDFKNNEKFYLSDKYQESQARQDFIDKFFAALGWDVTHERQKNPYEQEVKIENKVSTQGSQRRADYAFFIAPNFRDVKFYAEAKKPAKNLKDAAFYHQTIRYGWNSGTPIAILTDFEEFHILDCRYKPDLQDALNRQLAYFHYSEYTDEEKFKKIFYLFGREAVAEGSLEKYAATLPKPRAKAIQRGLFKGGYQQVDEAFLEELDSYRTTLAKAFKKENPDLGSEELTEAVQRTIDRLVFIRFLEDKQIEDPQIINYGEASSAWKKFSAHCRALEPKYNGLVFKKHRILDDNEFVPPDDKTFADICGELADPSSPYDFDKIPISILGSIYERFLGKVVNATDKRVKVEEKPEVRKAGGVYYTPQYIVRYIVRETVGKLLYGETVAATVAATDGRGDNKNPTSTTSATKTPSEVAKMSFADIACGSGSFLIEVYSELLEYHERYYAAHPEAAKKGDLSTRDGKQVLSLKKRQEILVNNIYGVDIDFQATEVTQLSLYLKLLEEATLNDAVQFSLLKEKLLPDLRNNIICGNSLIGTDIYDGDLFAPTQSSQSFPNASIGNLAKNESKIPAYAGMTREKGTVGVEKLKPMNFEDAFPAVMKKGGFDAVVGNPPYVHSGLIVNMKEYFAAHFNNYSGNSDLYVFFIEKAFAILSTSGKLGMIVSNKWIRAEYGSLLRGYLSKYVNIQTLIDFGELPVFKNVGTFPCIMIGNKPDNSRTTTIYVPVKKLPPVSEIDKQIEDFGFQINLTNPKEKHWTLVPCDYKSILEKLSECGIPLGTLYGGRIRRGVVTGFNPAFIIDKTCKDKLVKQHSSAKTIIHPFLSGDETRRYAIRWDGRFIIFTRRDIDINKYPSILHHLEQYRKELEPKRTNKDKVGRKPGIYKWYEIQDSTAYYKEFENPKIIYGQFQIAPHFSFSNSPMYFGSNHYMIVLDDVDQLKYLCGVLNSKVYFFFMKRMAGVLGDADEGGRVISQKSHILRFPIRKINFSNEAEKAKHDHIVSLVEQMLKAKEELASAKLDSDVQRLEHRCATLDRQIDEAVYELYGLTDEEIKIVEGK